MISLALTLVANFGLFSLNTVSVIHFSTHWREPGGFKYATTFLAIVLRDDFTGFVSYTE
jgi:hypothetical protein